MDIDSLNVKISSDSSKAVSAVDKLIGSLGKLNSALNNYGANSSYVKSLDNLSHSFDNIANSIGRIDTDKLKTVSSSIRSLGNSFKSLSDNVNNVNFTKVESAAKSMSDIVSKETNEVMKTFGITGTESVNEVSQAFKELASAVQNMGDLKGLNAAMKNANDALKDNARFANGAKDAYADLISYIQSTNSSGAKVYLPFDPSEFINDFSSMRASLGKAFTSDESFKNIGQDLASYVSEMNSVIGTTIDVSQNAEGIFSDLVNLLRNAKDGFIGYSDAVRQGLISQNDADEVINNFMTAIDRQNESLQKGGTSAVQYENSMESLVENINKLGNIQIPDMTKLTEATAAIRGLGGAKVLEATNNLPQLTNYLDQFVRSMNSIGSMTFDASSLTGITDAINKLGLKNASNAANNIPFIADGLKRLVTSMNQLQAVTFDTTGLTELVKTIGVLGGKSVTNAIANMPQLTKALTDFIHALSTLPAVNQNIIDTINSIARLASQGQKVGSAMNGLVNISNRSRSAIGGLGSAFNKTAKSGKGLAYMFGKMYASYFLLFRGIKSLGKSIQGSMDFVEVLNYFNASLDQIVKKADLSQWETLGYESAEAYANSFRSNLEKTFSKMSGFKIGENGQLFNLNEKTLGINPSILMNYQAQFAQMASSMGIASDYSIKLSNALTEIGADLASVKNLNFNEAWDSLSSALVGTARAADKFGINLRVSGLQQELTNLGLDLTVNKLSQADKALLRTITILDSSRFAWSDLADTIDEDNLLQFVA